MEPLTRVLYKAISRSSRSLSKEWNRGRLVLKQENELALIGYTTHTKDVFDTNVQLIVNQTFRNSHKTPKNLSKALETLQKIDARINTLKQMVYTPGSETLTRDIFIKVSTHHPQYFRNGSTRFTFSVQITNFSCTKAFEIGTGKWKILDGTGLRHEIDADPTGLVGYRPVLKPGESVQFTSQCTILSYHGVIRGFYGVREVNTDRQWFALSSNKFKTSFSHMTRVIVLDASHQSHLPFVPKDQFEMNVTKTTKVLQDVKLCFTRFLGHVTTQKSTHQ